MQENEYDELEQEEDKIKESLKFMPFETLLKIRNEVSSQEILEENEYDELINYKKDRKFIKPLEKIKKTNNSKSSKKPVPFFKQKIFDQKKKIGRDPRFDNLSGKLNKDLFEKSYTFLKEKKLKENEEFKKALKKKNYSLEEKEVIRKYLGQNKNELGRSDVNSKNQLAKKEFKKKNVEKVKKGLQPFFPKKKILKEKVLKQKYDELEKTGKLDKFIQEKKKRQSDKVYWQLSNLVKIKEKKMDK